MIQKVLMYEVFANIGRGDLKMAAMAVNGRTESQNLSTRSRLKFSLNENVVFSVCAHGQYHDYYIYHVEFYFWFRHLVSFPV